jgi:hypothetical protein
MLNCEEKSRTNKGARFEVALASTSTFDFNDPISYSPE